MDELNSTDKVHSLEVKNGELEDRMKELTAKFEKLTGRWVKTTRYITGPDGCRVQEDQPRFIRRRAAQGPVRAGHPDRRPQAASTQEPRLTAVLPLLFVRAASKCLTPVLPAGLEGSGLNRPRRGHQLLARSLLLPSMGGRNRSTDRFRPPQIRD